jgi:hypothetical protein
MPMASRLMGHASISRLQRQHQPEHGTHSARILAGEVPSMRPGISAGDRQPEAGAAGIVRPTMIKSYQALKDPVSLRWWHSRPGVPDLSDRKLIMLTYHQMHLALRAGGTHGIVNDVAQDAADLGGVGMGDNFWPAHRDDRVRVKQLYPIDFAPSQSPQGYRSKIKINSGVQPSCREQVRDEGARALSLAYEQGLQMLALITTQLIIVV